MSAPPEQKKADVAATSSTPAISSSTSSTSSTLVSSLPSTLVDSWLDHCTSCFSDKKPYPPARSYFERHMKQDPMLDLNGIMIVQVPDSEEVAKAAAASSTAAAPTTATSKRIITSTARVFVRQQYLSSSSSSTSQHISFGGIGEVCTADGYRSRGYAELVMNRCLDYARLLRLQLTALHCSTAMVSYYSRYGFTSIPRFFGMKYDWESEKDVNIVGEGLYSGPFSLRLMPSSQFFAPSMLPQFRAMYDSYSSQFNGPLVRSEEYWQNWVQQDIESSVGQKDRYPIEIYSAYEEWDGSDPAPVPASPIRFLSYLFLQRIPITTEGADNGSTNRDRVYVVREYAALPMWSSQKADGGRQMFLSLAQYAVRQLRHKFAQIDPEAATNAKLTLKFPLPITAKFKVPLKVDEEVMDEGFMYQSLPLNLNAVASSSATSSSTSSSDRVISSSPLSSPFAASPFVLHHESEEMNATSASGFLDQMKKDAKEKVVYWQTDAY